MSSLDSSPSRIHTLNLWSEPDFCWRPLLIGVSPFGRTAVHALRDVFNFNVIHAERLEVDRDDQELIEREACTIIAPYTLEVLNALPDPPAASARTSSDAEASAVPVLYIWPPCVGSWVELLVGVTDRGRELAPLLRDALPSFGVSTFLHGLDRDDPAVIAATARLITPPKGVAFIDPAPDGILEYEGSILSGWPN